MNLSSKCFWGWQHILLTFENKYDNVNIKYDAMVTRIEFWQEGKKQG